MTKEIFREYLINLGFTDAEFSGFLRKNYFSYSPDKTIPAIKYVLIENDEDILYLKENFKISSYILLGWSKYSYIYNDRIEPWVCSFKNLTTEGRKLYYSIKKLHNNSELRILTFNKIK